MNSSLTITTRLPPPLHIQVTGDARRPQVVLRGAADMDTADQVRHVLHDCAAMGSELVILDVAEVDLLAAAGLTALIDAREVLDASDAVLVLVRAGRAATRVLELTGLGSLLASDHMPVGDDDAETTAARSGSSVG